MNETNIVTLEDIAKVLSDVEILKDVVTKFVMKSPGQHCDIHIQFAFSEDKSTEVSIQKEYSLYRLVLQNLETISRRYFYF
jgi:hypothetical protein